MAGLIFCGNCGARYFMKSDCGGHYKYYKCYSRSKTSPFMIKDPTCKNETYREKELDEIIEDRIHQIALDKNSVKNKKKKEEDNISEIKTLEKKLSQLEKKIDKLLDLYQLETIPLNDIGKKLSEVYTEKRNVEIQIESLEEKKEEVSQVELEEVLTTIKEKWNNLDLREKRKLLSFLINRIIIFNNKEIKIEWAF
ncbi:MAG: recombinase zinc beta ribbon domain-containing protein [Candidatus Eremiobacterota bacterium]